MSSDKFRLFPESATEMAREIDALYFMALGITAFFSLLIAALVLYFAIRYRRRSENQVGKPDKGGIWLEIMWSVIPLLILLVMFGWGAKIFFEARRPPSDAVAYYVTAKQWMWKFQHPDGRREINDLHVPLGETIKLVMTSEDVIHSFFVPAFRVKMDVLPGRYTTLWFRADKAGTYRLFCTEYCGTEHSFMRGSVVVMEPRDYEAWLGNRIHGPQRVATGEELFTRLACDTCHRSDSAVQAPILDGIFGKLETFADGSEVLIDENYMRESILNPGAKLVDGYMAIMPTMQGRITEEELLQLIRYLKSLGEAAPAAAETAELPKGQAPNHAEGQGS